MSSEPSWSPILLRLPCLTHALALVVLVDEDVVQHEGQQLVLQRVVGVEDQRLETLPAARSQLVAEDHQQVAQEHERLCDKPTPIP